MIPSRHLISYAEGKCHTKRYLQKKMKGFLYKKEIISWKLNNVKLWIMQNEEIFTLKINEITW